jgi:hypothetical protein
MLAPCMRKAARCSNGRVGQEQEQEQKENTVGSACWAGVGCEGPGVPTLGVGVLTQSKWLTAVPTHLTSWCSEAASTELALPACKGVCMHTGV